MVGWILDQVLVDAECTHDGSVKHIQKIENWGWTTLQRGVLNAERTDNLTVLQVTSLFLVTDILFSFWLWFQPQLVKAAISMP